MATIYSLNGSRTNWASQPREDLYEHGPWRQYAAPAVTAAGAYGIHRLLSRIPKEGKENIYTKLYRSTRVGERALDPIGLLATFRVPNLIFPFTQFERVTEASGELFKPEWNGNTFKTEEQIEFLRRTVLAPGQDESVLYGVSQKGIRFEREGNGPFGRLVMDNPSGDPTVIADNIFIEGRGRSKNIGRVALASISVTNPEFAYELGERERQSFGRETKFASLDEYFDNLYNPVKKPGIYHDILQANGTHRVSEGIPIRVPLLGERLFHNMGHGEWYLNQIENRPWLRDKLRAGGRKAFFANRGATLVLQRLNDLLKTTFEQVPIISDIAKKIHFFPAAPTANAMRMLGGYAKVGGMVATSVGALDAVGTLVEDHEWAGALLGAGIGVGVSRLVGASTPSKLLLGVGIGAVLGAAGFFDGGIRASLARSYELFNRSRSMISTSLAPVPIIGKWHRDIVENFFPGASSNTMAVFVGLTAATGAAAYQRIKGRTYGDVTFKPGPGNLPIGLKPDDSRFIRQLKAIRSRIPLYRRTRHAALRTNQASRPCPECYSKGLGKLWEDVVGPWFDDYDQYLETVKHEGFGDNPPDWIKHQRMMDRFWTEKVLEEKNIFKRLGLQVKASFLGAETRGAARINGGKFALGLPRYAIAALSAMLAWKTVTGGFAASKTPQELDDLYQGKDLVPVRKGRYWEAGGTQWEGGNVDRWRPSWVVLAKSGARAKSIYGEPTSFLGRFWKKNFTYDIERENYWSRPYPITGQGFEEVPFLKWIIDPIGRLVKPAKLMHVNEWARYNQYTRQAELKHVTKAGEEIPSPELGGLPPGAPMSPYDTRHRLGEFNYQLQELAGLVGWASSLAQNSITGTSTLYSQGSRLQSASQIASTNRAFWEADVGGMFFMSEGIRRFLPRPRNEIGSYNPIPNDMPSWIPDNLRTGDPYVKIRDGEVILPGRGYEALHPELTGLDKEDYPLVHKYNILSQIAPSSPQFQMIKKIVNSRVSSGAMTDDELDFIARTDRRLMYKRQSSEYYGMVKGLNEETKKTFPTRAVNRAWSGFLENIQAFAAPIESMIPMGFRPSQKLLPTVNAIHDYESSHVYGTKLAFWNKPVRDWFRPAWETFKHGWLGLNGLPDHVERKYEVNEYFDKLEFYKWKNLEIQAREAGDTRTANKYQKLARKTLTGANPFDSFNVVISSVQGPDRDYFRAFSSEVNEGSRQRILELVTPSLGKLLEAQWAMNDYRRHPNEESLKDLKAWAATKGERYSDKEYQMYMLSSPEWLPYGDWKKLRNVEEEIDDQGLPLPRPDWTGWDPRFDIEDVKLKVVANEGYDIHDFNMWESQQRTMLRKPYITSDVVNEANLWNSGMMHAMADSWGTPTSGRYSYFPDSPNNVELDLYDSREQEITAFRKSQSM